MNLTPIDIRENMTVEVRENEVIGRIVLEVECDISEEENMNLVGIEEDIKSALVDYIFGGPILGIESIIAIMLESDLVPTTNIITMLLALKERYD